MEPRQVVNPNDAAQPTDNNAGSADSDYVINDNGDEEAVRPRSATSREGTITRDKNDVAESPVQAEQQDESERPNMATSRKNRSSNDTPNHSEMDDVTSELTDIRSSPNTAEDITITIVSLITWATISDVLSLHGLCNCLVSKILKSVVIGRFFQLKEINFIN